LGFKKIDFTKINISLYYKYKPTKMFNDTDSEDNSSDDSSEIIINDLNASESGTDNEIVSDSDSDISNFDEFDVDSDDEELYQEDSYHIYSEKQHDHYYIGLAKRISSNNLIMVNSVSSVMFFRYPFQRIREYLANYSIVRVENAKIHIMKLCILEDETYSVVLKTHWIRLIQRHWKKVFKQRKQISRERRSIKNMHFKELHGRHKNGLNYIPSIYGMMSQYTGREP